MDTKLYIGSHINADQDGLVTLLKNYHAVFGGTSVQILGGSSRFRHVASRVKQFLQETGIKLFIHSPFTLNLAKEVTYETTVLVKDLELAHAMGAEGCVLHMGKSVKLDRDEAETHFCKNIAKVLARTDFLDSKLFMETCAGQGTDLFATKDGSLDELVRFYSHFSLEQKERLKFCVDTCHIFAAGYDVGTDEAAETFWCEWQHKLGISALGVIHMNNSARPFQSRVDRHAILSSGYIGTRGLASFAQHAAMHEIPMIIETPFLEYDIPVLQAMIEGEPLPDTEEIRRKHALAVLSSACEKTPF